MVCWDLLRTRLPFPIVSYHTEHSDILQVKSIFQINDVQMIDAYISPAENKFDLELSSKVFFFTESRSVDIAFEESE